MTKLKVFLFILAGLLIIFFSPLIFTFNKIIGNYEDIYLHYYPLKHLVSQEIISGKIPLWNPYIFAGQPILANPQSAIFYPLNIIFYILPLHLAFNYSAVIHFFLGGLFFYLLLSNLRYCRSASLMGSIAYTFSSFLVYKLPAGHFIALTGYVWLPLIILFLNKISENNNNNIGWIFALGASIACQFLSGHIFPVYISLFFILVHFAYKKFVYWKNLLFSGIISFLIISIQLIPTVELSQVVETANWPILVKNYSLPLKNLISIVLPNFFGNIRDHTYIFQESPSYFIEKNCLYFGLLPLFFAGLGFYLSIIRKKYFYPVLFLIGIVLALGFNTFIYNLMYSLMPGIGFLRVPARFFYLSLIALIILSSYSWHNYAKKINVKLKIFLIIFTVVNLFVWGEKFIYSEDIRPFLKKSDIASYISPLYRIITEPEKYSANKSMMYRNFNLNGFEAVFLKDFTQYIGLQEKYVLTTTGLARWDLNSPLSKGFSLGYLVSSQKAANLKFLGEISKNTFLYALEKPLPKVFIAEKYVYIPDSEPYEQIGYLKTLKFSPDKEILLGTELKKNPWISGKGTVISYLCGTSKIESEISLSSDSIVVFSEMFYSGWKAAYGKTKLQLLRGNKIFRVLVLPKGSYIGKNKIILYFQSQSFIFGLYITLAFILSILTYLVLIRKYSKKIFLNRILFKFLKQKLIS
ncbi:MAG: hypothetical protein NT145_04935 [Elusimicrobia bacterium]|nr:hypothetical protein [Elusimicrobiota bacterium]